MSRTINVSTEDFELEFEVNEKVEWFDFEGSFVKNYSKIYRLTPKYAVVWNETTEHFQKVKKSKLNWS